MQDCYDILFAFNLLFVYLLKVSKVDVLHPRA